MGGVESYFSALLWVKPNALVYALAQAEQQMYHAIVNEDDIQFLICIPNLTMFWCCRCHKVAKDGSTAHGHLHALVQCQKGHRALKKRMQRAKERFQKDNMQTNILCRPRCWCIEIHLL